MPKKTNPFPRNPSQTIVEIKMMRSSNKELSFLLVEGDTDKKFWRPFSFEDRCDIIDCEGKNNVLSTLALVEGEASLQGVLGIVDDDFDTLEGISHSSPNLVKTDTHDLETMLLTENALGKMLGEYGDPAKARAFANPGETSAQGVLRVLGEKGTKIGNLRWLARREGWSEKNLNVWKGTNLTTWAIDEAAMEAALATENALDAQEVQRRKAALPASSSVWKICQGHDLVSLLVIGFRAVLGEASTAEDKLALVLRTSFSFADLEATELYREIRTWEAANPPFLVLRLPPPPSQAQARNERANP